MGLIVRTAGAKRTKAEIKRDYDYLARAWENIRDTTLHSIAPALIYEEEDLVKRAIRDLFDKDIDGIWVEGEAGYKEARDFMRMLMPAQAKKVQAYREPTPLFVRHRIEDHLVADLFADRAAEVRRLSGDQPDRGAGRRRRQLRAAPPRSATSRRRR